MTTMAAVVEGGRERGAGCGQGRRVWPTGRYVIARDERRRALNKLPSLPS